MFIKKNSDRLLIGRNYRALASLGSVVAAAIWTPNTFGVLRFVPVAGLIKNSIRAGSHLDPQKGAHKSITLL